MSDDAKKQIRSKESWGVRAGSLAVRASDVSWSAGDSNDK
jgi:hypothetical protein